MAPENPEIKTDITVSNQTDNRPSDTNALTSIRSSSSAAGF